MPKGYEDQLVVRKSAWMQEILFQQFPRVALSAAQRLLKHPMAAEALAAAAAFVSSHHHTSSVQQCHVSLFDES